LHPASFEDTTEKDLKAKPCMGVSTAYGSLRSALSVGRACKSGLVRIGPFSAIVTFTLEVIPPPWERPSYNSFRV